MTSDDLRAAAEAAVVSLNHVGDGLPDCWVALVETMANHILASLPDLKRLRRESDPTEIDWEWLKSLSLPGYLEFFGCGIKGTFAVRYHGWEVAPVKTRDDVRTLCRVLKIELKDPQP